MKTIRVTPFPGDFSPRTSFYKSFTSFYSHYEPEPGATPTFASAIEASCIFTIFDT